MISGSILDLMATADAVLAEQDRAAIEPALGLDVPIHIQYGRWVGGIITRGDLGNSLWTGTPVTEDILAKLLISFELGLITLIVALLIAFPVGIYSAIRQDTIGHRRISYPGFLDRHNCNGIPCPVVGMVSQSSIHTFRR